MPGFVRAQKDFCQVLFGFQTHKKELTQHQARHEKSESRGLSTHKPWIKVYQMKTTSQAKLSFLSHVQIS